MLDFKSIDDLARRLSDLVPPGLDGARADLEKNFRSALQAGLGRLDLVTREDFEVVRDMAAKARAENEALAKRIRELEAKLAADPSASD